MSEPINDQPSCPSWFIKIMEAQEEPENNRPRQPLISKVPGELRVEENNACYSPLVVSIGPHHYSDRKEKLKDMEKLKASVSRQFVKACHVTNPEVLYKKVKQAAQIAKAFYTDELLKDFTDEAFAEMMFIDGCFVLQFICPKEKLEMTDQQFAHVIRDLLLLENQLPFPVLESLMNLRMDLEMAHISDFFSFNIWEPTQEIRIWQWMLFAAILLFMLLLIVALLPLTCLLCCFSRHLLFGGIRVFLDSMARRIFVQRYVTRPNEKKDEVSTALLLELLHSGFIPGESKSSRGSRGNYMYYPSRGSRGNYVFHSAQNLKRMGIHLQPSKSGALTNIKFKTSIFSGTLELPPIIIHESTKALLLNLVAYETSAGLDQHWVTSYICFMASLIKDAEDVEELRSKGIIINDLRSDHEVAQIFSDMAKNLTPDPNAYNDVKKDINEQCKNVLKRWVAECQQKYFSSPWAFTAFVAAALGLILTAISTYKTVFPPKRS